jgi:tripartite-type tricarboxylate transporter receptor subunit TctC
VGGSVGNAAAARAEPRLHAVDDAVLARGAAEADRLFDRPVAYEVSQFAPIARVLADPTLLAVPARRRGRRCRNSSTTPKSAPAESLRLVRSLRHAACAMEMFAASAGIKLLHVPFRGAGPALTALLGGTVQAWPRRRHAEAAGR